MSVTVEEIKLGISKAGEFVAKGETDYGFDPSLVQKVVSVRRWEDLILINYRDAAQYLFPASEWSPFLKVCRGIVFSKDGALVSFPFAKMFNLGEISESEVAKWQIRSVTEKIDGVLIQVFNWKGRQIWASRHEIWSGAANIACKLCPDLSPLVKQIPFRRWTLMFELVCPEKRKAGMIDYGDMRALILLAVRDLDTYELVSACEVFTKPLPEPVLLPQVYSFSSLWEVREAVRRAQTPNWEGVVLQGAGELGNQLVKIKNPLYLERVAIAKRLTVNKILQNYEAGGLEQVLDLVAGYEEIVKELGYDALIEEMKKVEEEVTKEAVNLAGAQSISDIPQHLRWVKSYAIGSPKWQSSLRRIVVSLLERKWKRS